MKEKDIKIGKIVYPKSSVTPNLDISQVKGAYEIWDPKLSAQGRVIVERVSWTKSGWFTIGNEIEVPLEDLLTKDEFVAACNV